MENIYHDSVMLTWKPPLNDGGGFITQYIVEKQESGMTSWIRCCTTRYGVLVSLRILIRLIVRICFLHKV